MIPPAIVGFFAKHATKLAVVAGAIALLGLILMIAYCAGGQKEVNKQQERTIETLQVQSEASEAAANSRLANRLEIAEQQKELDDAIARGEDADTLRQRRGCLVLRQQGGSAANNPACRRFEGGGGADVPGGGSGTVPD
jgi:hypothetical protein